MNGRVTHVENNITMYYDGPRKMDVSAYRLIKRASGAILRQGTIERVHDTPASRPCGMTRSFPGVLWVDSIITADG